MASPFHVFRKHQKMMIAVLGVLAMFAFVFLPIILQRMDAGGDASNPVVVKTTAYGNLTARQLDALSQNHMTIIRFLGQVQRAAVAAGATGNPAGMLQQQLGDATQEIVVDTWLRAKHAERLGVVVSDNTVNQFIKDITENADNKGVSTFQLKEILKGMGITQVQLFDILRQELLAMRAGQLFGVSLGATTPAQRFDYFCRLKRKATIEVVPVPVADYLEDVAEEPSEETLRAFFEEHKEAYADPRSPEPGFRVPHRIAVNYLKADYETFGSPDLVTDEEVRAAYEEQKELYDSLRQSSIVSPPPTEDTPKEDAPAEDTPAEDTPAEDTPAEENPAEAETTGDAPAEEPPMTEPVEEQPMTEPTDGSAPEAPDDSSSAEAVEGDAADKPAGDAMEAEGTTEEAAPEAESGMSDDMSATKPASPFMLASFLQEEKTDEQGMADENTSPDTPAESTEEPAVGDTPPATETAEPAVEEPKMPAFEPRPETPAGPVVEQPTEEPVDEDDIVSTSIGQFIRQQLARQRTQTVMSDLQDQIMSYFRKRKVQETNATSGDGEKVDLAALDAAFAKEIRAAGQKSGLTWGVAPDPAARIGPMMSIFEAQEFEIGRTFILSTDRSATSFVEYAFEANRQLYEASVSMDREGSRYLFWKVADSKQRVPEFEDEGIQDEVRRVWKMQKARQLATDAAEALAEKARKDPLRSLSDSIGGEPGVEVAKTAPFSWLTRGDVPATTTPRPPARLTDLEPTVEMAGPDFMKTVFGLKKNEIAVVMNDPQKIAYVVRVSELNPPEKSLWAQFEVDGYDTYYDVGQQEQNAARRAWYESLRKEAGFERVEQPEDEQVE